MKRTHEGDGEGEGNTAGREYRLALCGVGRMGQIRADCLLAKNQFKVIYVIDPVSTKLRDEIASKLKAKVSDYLTSSVIEEVDAVMLCTPTNLHSVDIKLALSKRVPVFTEKPLATTKRDTYSLYSLARQSNVPIFAGYNRRAATPFQNLKKQCLTEDIQRISFTFRDNPMLPPQFLLTLGDIYEDLSCHDLDLTLWYLGEKPITAFAKSTSTFNDVNVTDSAAAILGFKKEKVLICDWTRKSTTNYDERVEVFLKDKTIFASMGENGVNKYSFRETYWDSYMAEIDQFLQIVKDFYEKGTFKLERDYDYCLWITDIVSAMQKSAISGREEYVLPFAGENGLLHLGFVCEQRVGKYLIDHVLTQHFWDYFKFSEISTTYKKDSSEALYFASAGAEGGGVEGTMSSLKAALADGKHIISDPSIFLSLSDYMDVCRLRDEKNHLILDFFLRMEPLMKKTRLLIADSKDAVISLDLHSSGSFVTDPTGGTVKGPTLLHEIDLCVYLSWPFVSAELHSTNKDQQSLHLAFSFIKPNGTLIKATIIRPLSQSQTTDPSTYQKTLKLHLNGAVVVDETIFSPSGAGHLAVLSGFYEHLKVVIAGLGKNDERQQHTSSSSTDNLTFYWTYKLNDSVNNKLLST